jgi:N-acetyl sugar amidotransferase
MNRLPRQYRMCSRCIMDTTDPDIWFDEAGVCSNCYRFDEIYSRRFIPIAERPERLEALLRKVRADGKGKEYDCVIGVSGGIDSTYVAYLTRCWHLRPLAVHFDNGWNSELAVSNIEKALRRLEIDLSTFVVDWPEFRDLQLSFLRASTPDGEIPTDHAIMALLYRSAAKYGLKHILLGTNLASESVMPIKWGYGYADFKYIRNVHRLFGSVRLATYPHFTLPQLFGYLVLHGIQVTPILDYVEYRKDDALRVLEDRLDWVYYGGKHYESIYTRFYQASILPRQFGIDKRRAHYSSLMHSNQLVRSEALRLLEEPVYPAQKLAEDRQYVIKRLGLDSALFETLMTQAPRTFLDYPNHYRLLERVKRVRKILKV